MRILIKDRGTGKTTGLIYASEATGYPIATGNENMVSNIKHLAEEMGCNIPEPATFWELQNGRCKGNRLYDTVLIDEVECILEDALSQYLGCTVKCATMSDKLKVKKNE